MRAMLADFVCDRSAAFDGICRAISSHDPTGLAGPLVERLIGPVVVLFALYLVGRVLRRVVDGAMRRSGADRQVRALVHNMVSVVTYVIAVLSAIVVAGVNVAVLLTVAGLGTVAVGLALQDVLRNILAGIWLLLEHPFRLGDNIAVVDQAGVVQTITLRTTTLRTGDGRLAVLPNLTAFSNPVINASAFQLRQFTVAVREPDTLDLEATIREARKVLEGVAQVARAPSPAVSPLLDGEHLLLQCKYWVDQKEHDPDAVAADVARRLWLIGRSAPPAAAAPAPAAG